VAVLSGGAGVVAEDQVVVVVILAAGGAQQGGDSDVSALLHDPPGGAAAADGRLAVPHIVIPHQRGDQRLHRSKHLLRGGDDGEFGCAAV